MAVTISCLCARAQACLALPATSRKRAWLVCVVSEGRSTPLVCPRISDLMQHLRARTSFTHTPHLTLTHYRCWPDDCDFNGHMGNSSYSKCADFGMPLTPMRAANDNTLSLPANAVGKCAHERAQTSILAGFDLCSLPHARNNSQAATPTLRVSASRPTCLEPTAACTCGSSAPCSPCRATR